MNGILPVLLFVKLHVDNAVTVSFTLVAVEAALPAMESAAKDSRYLGFKTAHVKAVHCRELRGLVKRV